MTTDGGHGGPRGHGSGNGPVRKFDKFLNVLSGLDILSGARDIIVVQQQDRSFVSTPFHVRFGKLKIVRSYQKVISLHVNGKEVEGVEMRIDELGRAYFLDDSPPDPSESSGSGGSHPHSASLHSDDVPVDIHGNHGTAATASEIDASFPSEPKHHRTSWWRFTGGDHTHHTHHTHHHTHSHSHPHSHSHSHSNSHLHPHLHHGNGPSAGLEPTADDKRVTELPESTVIDSGSNPNSSPNHSSPNHQHSSRERLHDASRGSPEIHGHGKTVHVDGTPLDPVSGDDSSGAQPYQLRSTSPSSVSSSSSSSFCPSSPEQSSILLPYVSDNEINLRVVSSDDDIDSDRSDSEHGSLRSARSSAAALDDLQTFESVESLDDINAEYWSRPASHTRATLSAKRNPRRRGVVSDTEWDLPSVPSHGADLSLLGHEIEHIRDSSLIQTNPSPSVSIVGGDDSLVAAQTSGSITSHPNPHQSDPRGRSGHRDSSLPVPPTSLPQFLSPSSATMSTFSSSTLSACSSASSLHSASSFSTLTGSSSGGGGGGGGTTPTTPKFYASSSDDGDISQSSLHGDSPAAASTESVPTNPPVANDSPKSSLASSSASPSLEASSPSRRSLWPWNWGGSGAGSASSSPSASGNAQSKSPTSATTAGGSGAGQLAMVMQNSSSASIKNPGPASTVSIPQSALAVPTAPFESGSVPVSSSLASFMRPDAIHARSRSIDNVQNLELFSLPPGAVDSQSAQTNSAQEAAKTSTSAPSSTASLPIPSRPSSDSSPALNSISPVGSPDQKPKNSIWNLPWKMPRLFGGSATPASSSVAPASAMKTASSLDPRAISPVGSPLLPGTIVIAGELCPVSPRRPIRVSFRIPESVDDTDEKRPIIRVHIDVAGSRQTPASSPMVLPVQDRVGTRRRSLSTDSASINKSSSSSSPSSSPLLSSSVTKTTSPSLTPDMKNPAKPAEDDLSGKPSDGKPRSSFPSQTGGGIDDDEASRLDALIGGTWTEGDYDENDRDGSANSVSIPISDLEPKRRPSAEPISEKSYALSVPNHGHTAGSIAGAPASRGHHDSPGGSRRGFMGWLFRSRAPSHRAPSHDDHHRPSEQPGTTSVPATPGKDTSTPSTHHRRTFRPSARQLAMLHLQPGKNEIMFTVSSGLRGRREIRAHIFMWSYDDKVVISDIDGTITRSDVLGHILPAIGKDWSHPGITRLYTHIADNGYKIVYLSSRSISQAVGTKKYIQNLKQDDKSLPEGPILLSPDRLPNAMAREVIYKNPEEFKIAALREVRMLFGPKTNVFYGGFGNRINDEVSYRAVDVEPSRIFIVSKNGLIRSGLSHNVFSTYSTLDNFVHEVFPCLHGTNVSMPGFNDLSYWKSMPSYISKDF